MADDRHYPSHRNKDEMSKLSVQTFGVPKSLINPFGTSPSLRETTSKHSKYNFRHRSIIKNCNQKSCFDVLRYR